MRALFIWAEGSKAGSVLRFPIVSKVIGLLAGDKAAADTLTIWIAFMKLVRESWTVTMLLASGIVAAAEVNVPSTNYVIVAPSQAAVSDRQSQLEWSARVFETLMGVRPPRGRIILTDTPAGSVMTGSGESSALVNTVPLVPQPPAADGTLWNLSWFINENLSRAAQKPSFTVLTHEAAHLQLVFTVNFHASADLKARFNGYGSFLPDWLDEAVAVFHEPDGLKAARRQRFNLRARIPLQVLFTMNHPGTTGRVEVLQIEAKTPEETRQKLAAFKASQHASLQQTAESLTKDRASVDEFYTECLAVIEYLIDRGGFPFFRFMLVEQNNGKTFDDVLQGWQIKFGEIIAQRASAEMSAARTKPPPRMIAPSDTAGSLPVWATKIAGVLVRPGEAVNRMPPSVDLLEMDFARWVQKNYPRYQPNLPQFPIN
jgi:hypothetical protein